MNLVAKEFVASRDDQDGALILSQFTGASRELRDAIIVNPYDTEQIGEAIRMALEMSPHERQARMQRMRRTVRENNVYRWAGNLITELSEIRLEEIHPLIHRPQQWPVTSSSRSTPHKVPERKAASA
jgi:trehalose 6-phosphate synthase